MSKPELMSLGASLSRWQRFSRTASGSRDGGAGGSVLGHPFVSATPNRTAAVVFTMRTKPIRSPACSGFSVEKPTSRSVSNWEYVGRRLERKNEALEGLHRSRGRSGKVNGREF